MAKINETVSITVGALAENDVIGEGSLAATQGGFVTTTDVLCQYSGFTAAEGTGVMLGVASGDLSDAEIEEAIEAQGPFFEGQTPQSERADRMVRFVGNIGPKPNELVPTTVLTSNLFLSFPTRIKFKEEFANMLRWFIYNHGTITLTTGATVKLTLLHNVRWSKA